MQCCSVCMLCARLRVGCSHRPLGSLLWGSAGWCPLLFLFACSFVSPSRHLLWGAEVVSPGLQLLLVPCVSWRLLIRLYPYDFTHSCVLPDRQGWDGRIR